MKNFSELIKNFDKIRDYMRDFFVYGFKSRSNFTQKSLRTYDNEKRRIESYLGNCIKYNNVNGEKNTFISLDSSSVTENPLYSVWKAKSFTNNDIILHFYLLDILTYESLLDIEQLTDKICEKYGTCFDTQTVRNKAKEYVKEGILKSCKQGRKLYYSLSKDFLKTLVNNYDDILDALKYYQAIAPFGVIGSYILDNEENKNDIFHFKHHFVVHTLEDKVLLEILKAINEKREINFINKSPRSEYILKVSGVPLKIFVSNQTGRRYVNIYNKKRKRFVNYRLDYIKSVNILDICIEYDFFKQKLEKNLDKCWGVSFGNSIRGKTFYAKFYVDEERELYILDRIKKEGRKGTLKKVDKNIYIYSKEIFDTNEIMSWIKSFTGRIISIESGDKFVDERFYSDMKKMKEMYLGGDTD
ncbi:WYL domain-containing protein [Clostridium pasteurianum]|uniref:WYL domain-containing protein n=1 Tax=Clostridium pasteurianum TaxID=1501 RepID=UPI00226090D4|nr:WYL domain-containing protein [Clostridium pasteurianum]UZW14681.1 WYL domain-containing protein [Clostridium pasteurianum]